MQLSPATARELQDALEEIAKDIAALEERAAAIRKVLGMPSLTTTKNPSAIFFSSNVNGSGSVVAPLGWDKAIKVQLPNPSKYDGMTLREVVKQQLRENPGSKAADVTRALRAEGYKTSGATRFSHRIYNEIWRMAQDGLVVRDTNGGFVLSP